ncbi:phage holin family protein [Nocardioides yefusunii]|uniref:Phage holin family protein n=1 Tax=Nocardioides yefusunii TaxID=2500546 RepID=A0ABW1QWT5_9ACTN|nr:phage holin family protein [Nocardioides yefusunii]
MRFISQLLSTMAALAVSAWIFDGIWFGGAAEPFADEFADKIVPLALVAVIMWLVSSVVTPIVKLLSLPFVIVTLGLFLFVVNAAMLLFVGWLADSVGIDFHVDGFWTALGGSIVITLVQRVVSGVLSDD